MMVRTALLESNSKGVVSSLVLIAACSISISKMFTLMLPMKWAGNKKELNGIKTV